MIVIEIVELTATTDNRIFLMDLHFMNLETNMYLDILEELLSLMPTKYLSRSVLLQ